MLKKVLCVVLALVLSLGTLSVIGSAATASDLATALASLPDDYNAQFYNDKTVAAIAAAKQAAATAATASEIDAATALCEEAYALVTETDVDDFDGEYFVNRDESKAWFNYNISTDNIANVPAGGTFDVTVSLKSNYYMTVLYLPIAYDADVFTVTNISYSDEMTEMFTITNPNHNWLWYEGTERPDYTPMEWNYALSDGRMVKEKYQIFMQIAYQKSDLNIKESWMPAEETEMYTVTFQVKEDATAADGKIFADSTWIASYFEYETDPVYYEQVLLLPRAYSINCWERYEVYDGRTIFGSEFPDVQANFDHTGIFGGKNAETYTSTDIYGQTVEANGAVITIPIGEEVIPADYTNLDAALATAATYDNADGKYTEASFKALTDAVDAGNAVARDLTEADQAIVDNAAAAINDAIAKLEEVVIIVSPIKNATTTRTALVGNFAYIDVVVDGTPEKLRFVDASNTTYTLTKDNALVTAVVDNGDGTQTWTIKKRVSADSEALTIFAKYEETGWDPAGYPFTLVAEEPEVDDRLVSCDIVDDVDGVMYAGVHAITVKTGLDVTKVQFKKGANTWTYTAENATVVEEDGGLTWTINMNFSNCGDNTYDIRTRTAKSAFASTGSTLDVLVYAV